MQRRLRLARQPSLVLLLLASARSFPRLSALARSPFHPRCMLSRSSTRLCGIVAPQLTRATRATPSLARLATRLTRSQQQLHSSPPAFLMSSLTAFFKTVESPAEKAKKAGASPGEENVVRQRAAASCELESSSDTLPCCRLLPALQPRPHQRVASASRRMV